MFTGQAAEKFSNAVENAIAKTIRQPTVPLRPPGSDPNVVCGRSFAGFVAGVKDTARLDEQQSDLFGCVGLAFNAFRNDEHLSG